MKILTLSPIAFALLVGVTPAMHAQDVISERREVMHGTAVPIGQSTSRRDTPGMRGSVTIGGQIPGAMATTQDSVVRVLAFQLPDFDPETLYTHHFHVGMFSENGNGSGTVFPDDNGYVEFEQQTAVGETPMTTFLYSVHAETGEVRVFIDVDPITVNRAASVLSNLALNGMGQRGIRPFGANRPRAAFTPPLAVGDQRMVRLSGDNLTLDDLQEQIFAQTGCDVGQLENDFRYQLVGCN